MVFYELTFPFLLEKENMKRVFQRINFGILSFIRQPKSAVMLRYVPNNMFSDISQARIIGTTQSQQNEAIGPVIQKKIPPNIFEQFKVETIYNHEDVSLDEPNNVVFELKLVDMSSEDKYQRYIKTFICKDINELKVASGIGECMKTSKFVEFLLYALSDKNKKYPVSYNVVKEEGKHLININIGYKTEFLEFDLDIEIPAVQMTEIELLKLRLHEAEKALKSLTPSRPLVLNCNGLTDPARSPILGKLSDVSDVSGGPAKLIDSHDIEIQPGTYLINSMFSCTAGSAGLEGIVIQSKSNSKTFGTSKSNYTTMYMLNQIAVIPKKDIIRVVDIKLSRNSNPSNFQGQLSIQRISDVDTKT